MVELSTLNSALLAGLLAWVDLASLFEADAVLVQIWVLDSSLGFFGGPWGG